MLISIECEPRPAVQRCCTDHRIAKRIRSLNPLWTSMIIVSLGSTSSVRNPMSPSAIRSPLHLPLPITPHPPHTSFSSDESIVCAASSSIPPFLTVSLPPLLSLLHLPPHTCLSHPPLSSSFISPYDSLLWRGLTPECWPQDLHTVGSFCTPPSPGTPQYQVIRLE